MASTSTAATTIRNAMETTGNVPLEFTIQASEEDLERNHIPEPSLDKEKNHCFHFLKKPKHF